MITTAASFLLMSVFLFISFLHLYWVLGGKWATDRVYPQQLGQLFQGGKMSMFMTLATLVVAVAFMVFAYLVAAYNGRVVSFLPDRIIKFLLIAMTVVFCIRSIGDFKYVGFFKSVKEGLFAYWDSKLYSPLCLGIAISLVVLLYFSNR